MTNDIAVAAVARPGAAQNDESAFVILTLADQLCGVPVLAVRDVLADQAIARIPLAPREVAGNLNLRGRIVTAIDLRERLRLPPRADGAPFMSIVTEQGTELYALLVDQVSEVLTLRRAAMEANPPTLPRIWAEHSHGIYRLEQRLMVVLDVERLLQIDIAAAA
ncbi:MAG: chemotaxis protein CheW [Rhodospirillales bacterium]